LLRERGRHDVEQPPGFCPIAQGRANDTRVVTDGGGQIAERAGARVELAAQLRLHARQRLIVGRSESGALDRTARGGDGERDEQSAGGESPG
jgi:hypothetical protein